LKISKAGIRLIAGHEGFRAKPYICAGGKKTIGYGHVILPHEKFTQLTPQEASNLLGRDVEAVEHAINTLVTPLLHQYMFDALVSFVYNVGTGNFQKSTLLKHINMSQYRLAVLEFCKWNKAGGQRLQGLINRRAEEQLLFTIGAVKAGFII
jgi:lysozyme